MSLVSAYLLGALAGWCFAKECLPFQRNGFFARKPKDHP